MSEPMIGEMIPDDLDGGCDACCDIAPFPDSQPGPGDKYECPHCKVTWYWCPPKEPMTSKPKT